MEGVHSLNLLYFRFCSLRSHLICSDGLCSHQWLKYFTVTQAKWYKSSLLHWKFGSSQNRHCGHGRETWGLASAAPEQIKKLLISWYLFQCIYFSMLLELVFPFLLVQITGFTDYSIITPTAYAVIWLTHVITLKRNMAWILKVSENISRTQCVLKHKLYCDGL